MGVALHTVREGATATAAMMQAVAAVAWAAVEAVEAMAGPPKAALAAKLRAMRRGRPLLAAAVAVAEATTTVGVAEVAEVRSRSWLARASGLGPRASLLQVAEAGEVAGYLAAATTEPGAVEAPGA